MWSVMWDKKKHLPVNDADMPVSQMTSFNASGRISLENRQ
jgi:hypothetical protein